MFNFLLAASSCAGNASSSGAGCYDWPIIKQIVTLFGWAIEYIYKFFDLIGIANIGLVIIVFTLIVKFILLPLTIKQQKFSKLTSIMQPEIKAIQKKYEGRRDNYSMQAMQEETKMVYAKYGVSQMGGCLQTFIQMPIIIALYGAIRQLPTLINALSQPLGKIVDILNNSGMDFSSIASGLGNVEVATSTQMTTLYSLPLTSWDSLISMFNSTDAAAITKYHEQMQSVNSFLGFDLSQTPWNLMLAGGIGIIAVLIPLIAGASQWLSMKLTQAKKTPGTVDTTTATMNSMSYVMPLISVFFCFTFNAGIGLYWAASSLFQVVLQIFINRHYRKIDMEEFIKKNMEKAEEKAKKKREKKGVKADTLYQAANTNTKNIQQAPTNNPNSIAAKANMNVTQPNGKNAAPPENSLAAKAAMVQQFNQEQGDVPDDSSTTSKRKKYKK